VYPALHKQSVSKTLLGADDEFPGHTGEGVGGGVELGGEAVELGGEAVELGGEAVELGGEAVELGGEAVELGGEAGGPVQGPPFGPVYMQEQS